MQKNCTKKNQSADAGWEATEEIRSVRSCLSALEQLDVEEHPLQINLFCFVLHFGSSWLGKIESVRSFPKFFICSRNSPGPRRRDTPGVLVYVRKMGWEQRVLGRTRGAPFCEEGRRASEDDLCHKVHCKQHTFLCRVNYVEERCCSSVLGLSNKIFAWWDSANMPPARTAFAELLLPSIIQTRT